MSKKNCYIIILLCAWSLLLSACTSPLWNRTPPPSQVATGAVSGAIGGAAIGGMASAGIATPIGAAIGGMWGGTVGYIIDKHQSIVEQILYSGVQIIRVGDEIRLILPSDRFFYADSANLNPAYYGVLTKVILFVRAFHKIDVKIACYTDNSGDWRRNLALSRLQAKQNCFYDVASTN